MLEFHAHCLCLVIPVLSPTPFHPESNLADEVGVITNAISSNFPFNWQAGALFRLTWAFVCDLLEWDVLGFCSLVFPPNFFTIIHSGFENLLWWCAPDLLLLCDLVWLSCHTSVPICPFGLPVCVNTQVFP
jgi:hypothetical protein